MSPKISSETLDQLADEVGDDIDRALNDEEHRQGRHPTTTYGCPTCMDHCQHPQPWNKRYLLDEPGVAYTCRDCGHRWIILRPNPGIVERR